MTFSQVSNRKFNILFIVNPLAGFGGALANKGSDTLSSEEAIAEYQQSLSYKKTVEVLRQIQSDKEQIQFYTPNGWMGALQLEIAGFDFTPLKGIPTTIEKSTRNDTKNAISWAKTENIDLILFAGGDGTASDIASSVEKNHLLLGIPSGVKMHSAVFAINPVACAEIIHALLSKEAMMVEERLVKDLDETQLLKGNIISTERGLLKVPYRFGSIQSEKGHLMVDELSQLEIVEYLVSLINEKKEMYWILGSGKLLFQLKSALAMKQPTLLGFDVFHQNKQLLSDANQIELDNLCEQPLGVVVTFYAKQGILFGRANQQLSPKLLKQLRQENIYILATYEKLKSLNEQPIRLDTGDDELNQQLSGHREVIIGYDQKILYPFE